MTIVDPPNSRAMLANQILNDLAQYPRGRYYPNKLTERLRRLIQTELTDKVEIVKYGRGEIIRLKEPNR